MQNLNAFSIPAFAAPYHRAALVFATAVLVALLTPNAVRAADKPIIPPPPQVAAKAYLLVDADSGAVLAEHNADLPLPPASLTSASRSIWMICSGLNRFLALIKYSLLPVKVSLTSWIRTRGQARYERHTQRRGQKFQVTRRRTRKFS